MKHGSGKNKGSMRKGSARKGWQEKPTKALNAAKSQANILYGYHACFEALANKSRHVKRAIIGHGYEKDQALTDSLQKRGLKTNYADKAEFEAMGLGQATHQNIILEVEPLGQPSIEAVIHKIRSHQQERSILVMLDQVTDPHNIGAIMRSACAFGAAGMIVQDRHAPELNGLIAKIASGAVEHLPYIQETNLSRTLRYLRDEGFFCIGLDERGENNLPEYANSQHTDICLVLGAEGQGLRRLVAENCDALVALPTKAPIQSLNVSNAAAVTLYALASKV